MGEDNLKISCVLVGDAALDFEKCQVTLKIPARAPGKQRQQALAMMPQFSATKPKRARGTLQ